MKKTIHPILTAAACLAAALCACIALAACTGDADEPIDAGHGRTPLVINASVAAPATTRSNTAANQWTDGDVVAVEMNDVVKKYIVKAAAAGATASLRPADEANTHYWPGLSQPVKVRAWRYGGVFPLSDNFSDWDVKPAAWTVSASQYLTTDGETGYQRSDFLYAPAKSVSYDASSGMGAGLTFYHQTARVVVKIRKAGLVNDGNKESMDVSLGRGGTDVTMLMQGTFDASRINPAAGKYSGLTADGATEKGTIVAKPMPADAATHGYARCYEALVIPQNMDGERFICIVIPGTGAYYYKPAPGEANLQGGYTYTYDIIVSKYGTLHVTVGTPIAQWGQQEGGSGTAVLETTPIDLDNPQTISDDGAYLMTGTNQNGNILNITGGKPLVILRDLLFRGHIHITGGTPEIRVEGKNNELQVGGKPQPMIWLDGADANVRITGEGIDKSKIRMFGDHLNSVAGIGSPWTGSKEATACGNIEISNLELMLSNTSRGGNPGGPCIGASGGGGSRKCGNITITNAALILYSYEDVVNIGFGCPDWNADVTGITYEMGDITITNSTIESKVYWRYEPPTHIGGGGVAAETYRVGTIRIDTGKNATDFFAKFDMSGSDDVIVGFPVGAKPKNGEEFDIYWNGEQVGPVITGGMVPGLQ